LDEDCHEAQCVEEDPKPTDGEEGTRLLENCNNMGDELTRMVDSVSADDERKHEEISKQRHGLRSAGSRQTESSSPFGGSGQQHRMIEMALNDDGEEDIIDHNERDNGGQAQEETSSEPSLHTIKSLVSRLVKHSARLGAYVAAIEWTFCMYTGAYR